MKWAWKIAIGVGTAAALASAGVSVGSQRRARLGNELLEAAERRDPHTIRDDQDQTLIDQLDLDRVAGAQRVQRRARIVALLRRAVDRGSTTPGVTARRSG